MIVQCSAIATDPPLVRHNVQGYFYGWITVIYFAVVFSTDSVLICRPSVRLRRKLICTITMSVPSATMKCKRSGYIAVGRVSFGGLAADVFAISLYQLVLGTV